MPHSAILNRDIVEEILVHLRVHEEVEGTSVGRGWATLASAARVCTAFHEPATKALWWSIPAIEPVLHVLVKASWLSVSGPNMEMAVKYFIRDETRDIPEDVWRRLRQCTSYTRVILQGSSRVRISPNVYVVLSHKSLKDPLFPHLRRLTWHSSTPDHLGLLPLLSPTLQELTFDLGSPHRRSLDWVSILIQNPPPVEDPSTDQLLQTVLPRITGLTRLEVRVSNDIPHLRDSISWACFAQVNSLRALTLDHRCTLRDVSFLRELALLPNLTELSIHILLDIPSSIAPFDGFCSLQKLSLHVLGQPEVDFLRVFNSPGLHTFWILFLRLRTDTLPATLGHIANAYPGIRSITIKELSVQDRGVPPAPGATFEAAFGKLTRCLSLEEFTLHTYRGAILCTGSDSHFALLAQSWPALRVFSFLAELSGDSPPTHRTIAAFARHCPQLRVLHLRGVSFRALTKEALRELPPSDHALEELGICAVRGMSNTLRSARFLCRLFLRMRVPVTTRWTCPVCAMTTRFGECANVFAAVFSAHNLSLIEADKVGPRAARRPSATASGSRRNTQVARPAVEETGSTSVGVLGHVPHPPMDN
ncbi:hypothetical protein C8Q77DRAFT_290125 [Trametes polyzona]|nr:hypothetical protein C8Q77DRAFT_290125 [Trametes polyzona]